jgi:hypothetical protein
MPLDPALAKRAGIPQYANAPMPPDMITKIEDTLSKGQDTTQFAGTMWAWDKPKGIMTALGPAPMITALQAQQQVGGPTAVGIAAPGTVRQVTPETMQQQLAAAPPVPAGTVRQVAPAPPSATQPQPLQPGPPVAQGPLAQAQRQAGVSPTQTITPPAIANQPVTPAENDVTAQSIKIPQMMKKDAINGKLAADKAYIGALQGNAKMQTIINLARRGNITGYNYASATGVLEVNTSFGTTRLNTTELKAYGQMPILDRIQSWFMGHATGASIPPDILQSMSDFHNALTSTAVTGYHASLYSMNSSIPGAAFRPLDISFPPSVSAPGKTLMRSPGGNVIQEVDDSLVDGFKRKGATVVNPSVVP